MPQKRSLQFLTKIDINKLFKINLLVQWINYDDDRRQKSMIHKILLLSRKIQFC